MPSKFFIYTLTATLMATTSQWALAEVDPSEGTVKEKIARIEAKTKAAADVNKTTNGEAKEIANNESVSTEEVDPSVGTVKEKIARIEAKTKAAADEKARVQAAVDKTKGKLNDYRRLPVGSSSV